MRTSSINYKIMGIAKTINICELTYLRMKAYIKRAISYVPLVINTTVDWCEYFDNRNNAVLKRFLHLVEKYSNMHTKRPIYPKCIYLKCLRRQEQMFLSTI